MTREIKFRAWDKENRKWIRDGYLISAFGGETISIDIIPDVIGTESGNRECDMELMQYTGLKDVRGVEIYEGDILTCSWGTPLIVSFREDWGAFIVSNSTLDDYEFWDMKLVDEQEVIGNIHQNPELLNG